MQNAAHNRSDDRYYSLIKTPMFPHIPQGANVIMDLGCGSGRTGRKLMELGKASELHGVEIFSPAAEEAARFYKQVHCGDVETMALPYEGYFDMVICGDILEHLKDPYRIVANVHRWLKPNGKLLCCVPNVRYWALLAELIFKGTWEYVDAGILDRTHLRFFTRRTCCRMLTDAGFGIEDVEILIRGRKRLFNRLTWGLFEEFLGTQVMVIGRKRG